MRHYKSAKQAVHEWAGGLYAGALAEEGCDVGQPERGKTRPYATQRSSEYDWGTKNSKGSRIHVTVRVRADREREADRLAAMALEEMTAPGRPDPPSPLYIAGQELEHIETVEHPKERGRSYFTARTAIDFYVGRTD